MDESEMCSIGSSVIKHSFFNSEGGRFNYNNPHFDSKCGYCIDHHSTCGGSYADAVSDIERAIGKRQDLQGVLSKHAKVAKYDPESGQVMVRGCGENAVGIPVPEALRGGVAE
jgi:hypothetical protein